MQLQNGTLHLFSIDTDRHVEDVIRESMFSYMEPKPFLIDGQVQKFYVFEDGLPKFITEKATSQLKLTPLQPSEAQPNVYQYDRKHFSIARIETIPGYICLAGKRLFLHTYPHMRLLVEQEPNQWKWEPHALYLQPGVYTTATVATDRYLYMTMHVGEMIHLQRFRLPEDSANFHSMQPTTILQWPNNIRNCTHHLLIVDGYLYIWANDMLKRVSLQNEDQLEAIDFKDFYSTAHINHDFYLVEGYTVVNNRWLVLNVHPSFHNACPVLDMTKKDQFKIYTCPSKEKRHIKAVGTYAHELLTFTQTGMGAYMFDQPGNTQQLELHLPDYKEDRPPKRGNKRDYATMLQK